MSTAFRKYNKKIYSDDEIKYHNKIELLNKYYNMGLFNIENIISNNMLNLEAESSDKKYEYNYNIKQNNYNLEINNDILYSTYYYSEKIRLKDILILWDNLVSINTLKLEPLNITNIKEGNDALCNNMVYDYSNQNKYYKDKKELLGDFRQSGGTSIMKQIMMMIMNQNMVKFSTKL